ncbi:MAG: cell division topological specificity factor MinE [Pseudomonadota bacterium]|nr:cell division topological specificity factor MinE [Pseudomonadota bacterium]
MSILDYLTRNRNKKSASMAKERLQIILAHEHTNDDAPDYLPALKQELLAVVSKYANIDLGDIKVNLDREGGFDILELNITLPEHEKKTKTAARR